MDLERERQIEQLCAEAFELPEGEVDAFLARVCGGDAELAEDVKDMLMWMERPAELTLFREMEDDTPTVVSPMRKRPWGGGDLPERIGHFHVLEKLGEGGMGQVFLCRQNEPVVRQVAVKLINSSISETLDEAHVALESRAMAVLSHPNIAQIFEVGDTPEGLHFFAMEYVPGKPLNTYCDTHALTLAERLRLFVKICRGVQHAHRKGIIHRDLKPGNILVTDIDGTPVPKIIDFGIATNTQALSGGDVFKAMVGTPVYMAPEVVRGNGSEALDTRVDVYALGIILFELLTDGKPIDTDNLSISQILRRIIEEPLPRPAAFLAALDADARRQVAQRRSMAYGRYMRALRHELDWIVATATAHNPEDRYESAERLARDVLRYLQHDLVGAVPRSTRYALGKYLRRHLVGLAAASLLAGFGALGVGLRLLETRRAEDAASRADVARREAEQVSSFLIKVFQEMDPRKHYGEPLDVSQLLDESMARAETQLHDQPRVRARLMLTTGMLQAHLGRRAHGQALLERALDLLEPGGDSLDLALALGEVGRFHADECHFEQARRLLTQSHDIYVRLTGAGSVDSILARGQLVSLLFGEGKPYAYLDGLRRLVADLRAAEGPNGFHTAKHQVFLGIQLMYMGDYPEAESLVAQGTATLLTHHAEDHPVVTMARTQQARIMRKTGRYRESAALLERVVRERELKLGTQDSVTANAWYYLGMVYTDLGRLGEAEQLLVRALENWEVSKGPRYRFMARGYLALGTLYLQQGLPDKAEETLEKGRALVTDIYGPDHFLVAGHLTALGDLHRARRDWEGAERCYRRSLAILDASMPVQHPDRIANLVGLGAVYHHTGRTAEARDCLGQARLLCARMLPHDHPAAARAHALSRLLPAG